MRQEELPAGIAYGFHIFPESPNTGKFYSGRLVNQAVAVIPERDWDRVPDGAELITMYNNPKTKGKDTIDMRTQHGYLFVGFVLEEGLSHFDPEVPVTHCLRCGSEQITRTVIGFDTVGEVPFVPVRDRVECAKCQMWWEDPHVGPEVPVTEFENAFVWP